MIPAAVVYRGRHVESVHGASVAVVDGRGRLCHALGDPRRTVVARSSIKPFQALPLILSGAAARYGFDDRQLAIMCGSHNGTDEHRDVVLAALHAAGNEPAELACGCHVPLGLQLAGQVPTDDEHLDPLRHNCSGKHAGFLAQAAHLEEERQRYLDPDSETQRRVRALLADFCELDRSELDPCVDGCSAPNYALPLAHLALGFMKLATLRSDDPPLRTALAQVVAAMRAAPEMVSGDGRLDLDLTRALGDRILCKVGGEAIEAMAWTDPPLGIAVKIHDGSFRALRPVCVEVLRQLGLVKNPESHPTLRRHVRPTLTNDAGLETGHIETTFQLEPLL
ncbi:MAG: asparaginase [Deltaproteobacteria bacterium]|jgi:L-asparaginase II|nr:asparaginase [Deltaproteobacteria bacterium]MBW2534083.1 asparaginase [Deltaproteobacteria bacterium]